MGLPDVSLVLAIIGCTTHVIAIVGNRMQIPNHVCAPEVTHYLGMMTWLTVQTNLICIAYFAAGIAGFDDVFIRFFPLAFSLGFMLSILYYVLDHFNANNQKKRASLRKQYPLCELACHLEHAGSTPIALLNACTLRLPAGGPTRLGLLECVLPYLLFYLTQTLVNHVATRAWQYPVIGVAQKAAGWLGVLGFFATIICIMMGAGCLGNLIVDTLQ